VKHLSHLLLRRYNMRTFGHKKIEQELACSIFKDEEEIIVN